MKKLITILLILFSFAASAQTYKYLTIPGETGYVRGAVRVDGVLWLGNDTLPVPTGVLRSLPALIGKGDSLYRWSPVQGKWIPLSGGSAAVWGSITGSIANQADLQAALNNKQNKLLQGTTAQYFRGDLSLGTFSTDVLNVINGQYAPASHTHNGLVPTGGAAGYVLRKVSGTDYDMTWQPIETVSPVSSVFGRVGAVIAQPGDYGAYYPSIQRFLDSLAAIRAGMGSTDLSGLSWLANAADFDISGPADGQVNVGDTVSIAQSIKNRITDLESRTDPDLTNFVTWPTINVIMDTLTAHRIAITNAGSSSGTTYIAPFTGTTNNQYTLPKKPTSLSDIEVHVGVLKVPNELLSLTVNTVTINTANLFTIDTNDRVEIKYKSTF